MEGATHCAYIAIVGRPNVGKSTLLNAVGGEKLAAVSKVPQTTRRAVRAVVTRGETQLVFVDLPGFQKPKTLLGTRLNEEVEKTASDADLIVLMVDAEAGVGRGDEFVARRFCAAGIPAVVVVNKVDRASKAKTVEALAACKRIEDALAEPSGFAAFAEYYPVSAMTGEGLHALLDGLAAHAPEAPFLFPPDQVSDEGESELAGRIADIIREKLIAEAREELPYSIAVKVEEMAERSGESAIVDIDARVFVERKSQKGIVIGKGGEALKRAGSAARPEIEDLLGRQVFLSLTVSVAKDWQRDPKALERLGY